MMSKTIDLEGLTTDELILLRMKIDCELRQRRIKEVMKNKEKNKNPLVQMQFRLFELLLNSSIPVCYKIDAYLDWFEVMLDLDEA